MTTQPVSQPPPGVGLAFLKLGSGEVAARVIAFVATVYVARTLGAPIYGVIVLATTIMLYFAVLTDCGIEALGVRDVAADPGALPRMLPSVLGARLLVAAVLVVIAVVVGLTVMPQPEGAMVAAYAFSLLAVAFGTRWAHVGLEQSGYASAARVLTEAISAAMIIALVRQPGDLARLPVTQLIGEAAGALLLLRLLPAGASRLRAAVRPEMVRNLIRTSWPLVLHALLGLAIFNSDFIVLRAFRDSATVGIYAAAYTLISFFLNLGAAYTMSLLPAITRSRNDTGATKALFDGSMVQALAGAVPVAIGGFLVAEGLIVLVFGTPYIAAALPLQILLWSIPVALIRNVAQAVLVVYGRQDQLLRTAIWAAVVNVSLNVTLIPSFGMAGAAISTLVTETMRTILVLRCSHRLSIPMTAPFRFRRVIGAALAMGTAVWVVGGGHVALRIGVGAATYVTALAVFGAFRVRRGKMLEFTP